MSRRNPQDGVGAHEKLYQHYGSGEGIGLVSERSIQVEVADGSSEEGGPAGLEIFAKKIHELERLLAEKTLGGGFFQRCLAKNRSSTSEKQRLWRDGVYDQIRELMPMQGSLSIERMCHLAQVSRAGFYRSLGVETPQEDSHGSADYDPANRSGTSPALWVSARNQRAEDAGDTGQSQASSTHHAGR